MNKYVLGETDVPKEPIPHKSEWFREGDGTVRRHLDSLVKKYSAFRRLRIIEPYISLI